MRFLLMLSSALLAAGMIMHLRNAEKPALRYGCYAGGLIGLITFQAFLSYPWNLLCIGAGMICGSSWCVLEYAHAFIWKMAGRIILALCAGGMIRLLGAPWLYNLSVTVAIILCTDLWMEARWHALWRKKPAAPRPQSSEPRHIADVMRRTPHATTRRPQPATA